MPSQDALQTVERSSPNWLDRVAGWSGRRERTLLLAIVLGQLLVLVAIATLHAAPLVFGQTVVLDTLPVDPHDFFRGDYVTLRYAFSNNTGMTSPVGPPMPGSATPTFTWQEDQPAYVRLTQLADGQWQAGPAQPAAPATKPYLTGRYTAGEFRFGIEAYYVQEGEGKALEDTNRAGKLQAEIAVAPWGQATLRALRQKP